MKKFNAILVMLAALALPGTMLAEEAAESSFGGGSGGGFQLKIDFGTAENDLTGKMRVDDEDGTTTAGTEFDFVDDLGIESTSSTRFGARLQLGGFWVMGAMQDVDFSGDRVITQEIVFGGETYETGARVQTEFESVYYQAKLGFRIWSADVENGDWFEMGFGIGVHVFDFDISLKGTDNTGTGGVVVSEEESFPAPIPTLGLLFGIKPATWLSIDIEVWGLYVPLDEVDAYMFDANATVLWYPLSWIGIGARVGVVTLSADLDYGEENVDLIRGNLELSTFQISGVVAISF